MANNPFGETPIGLVAQIMNLATILSRPFVLRIPPFQRPYTWTVAEVAQLLEDLEAAFRRNAAFYFIGQIVFVKAGREFEISDGQQRLTTLSMLIAFARDRLPQHAELYQSLLMTAAEHGRIRLRQADADFFATWVQTPGRIFDLAALQSFETDAQECLIHAAREIVSFFSGSEYDNRKLDAFVRYIARAAIFTVIDADEPGAAITVFETMNNRGQDLSGTDILKGALLANPELTPEDVTKAAATWERLEIRAGREAFTRLLRYVPPLLRAGALISPGDVAALIDTISKRVGVRKFLLDWLPRHCDAHRELYNGAVEAGPDSADVNRRIRCLQLLDPLMWEPLAIDYLATRGADRSGAQRFFLQYERLMAACALNVLEPKVRRARMDAAWRAHGEDAKLTGPRGALDLAPGMRADLRNRIGGSSRRDKMRRYIVWRINAAMGEVLDRGADANVEHVLPATPTEYWLRLFPRDPKRYGQCANMIGNYVLVTDKQDDEAANRTFPEKRVVYFDRGYPVRAITRDLETVMEWDERALARRQEILCRIMGLEWEITERG